MRRRETKTPQGQAEEKDDPGREERKRREAALERLAFTIYQVGLARRRVQDIMEAEDLAMVLYTLELHFVYTVLSDVDGLLRRLRRNALNTQDS